MSYENWHGTICYTGIGRYYQKHTEDYVADWLCERAGPKRSFQEIVDLLLVRGTDWIREIQLRHGQRHRHSFLITAFIEQVPKIALISNFESLFSPHVREPSDQLESTEVHSTKTRVFVHGMRPAVSRKDLKLLRHLDLPMEDRELVRGSIATMIERASSSPKSAGTVSRASLVFTLESNNRMDGRVYGDGQAEFRPRQIIWGLDPMKNLQLRPAPGQRVKLAAVSIMSPNSRPELPTACALEPESPTALGAWRAELVELQAPAVSAGRAWAINNSGNIVGDIPISHSGPMRACVWSSSGDLTILATLGGFSSLARDINGAGEIVGASDAPDGQQHVVLWRSPEAPIDIGPMNGGGNHAVAINTQSQVAGTAHVASGGGRSRLEMPFYWDVQSGAQLLGSPTEHWARAVGISDGGEILCISPVAGTTRSFVWTATRGFTDLGTLGGSSAHAKRITRLGTVLGVSEDHTGRLRRFVWSRERGMRLFEAFDQGEVADETASGHVLVHYDTAVGVRSAVVLNGISPFELPTARYHQATAVRMNDTGYAVGHVWRSNDHTHPVFWRLLHGTEGCG